MKSKTSLILCLYLNLLSGPISAGPIEKIIRIGDRSPIDAVLVPNDRYRFYQEQVEMNEFYRSEWQDCEKSKVEGKDEFVWGLISGFAVGLLVVSVAR
jgi:hypothetical protein